MKFRLMAFGLHLATSTIALALLLGGLYAGWYRWPGWYLADAAHVLLVLIGVDLVVGPSLTFVAASETKAGRTLRRDIAVIAILQLIALSYGAWQLWNGRPLYYAFSENVLQLIQAYDIDPAELAAARARHLPLLPTWHNLPRWIWAPLPADTDEQNRIIAAAVSGGDDVTGMPKYYREWQDGLPQLRGQLKKVDDLGFFTGNEKKVLRGRLRAQGISTGELNSIPFIGRGKPLLAVFDPATMTLRSIIRSN